MSKIIYLDVIKCIYKISRHYYHPKKHKKTDRIISPVAFGMQNRDFFCFSQGEMETILRSDGPRNAQNCSHKVFVMFGFCHICRHCTDFVFGKFSNIKQHNNSLSIS